MSWASYGDQFTRQGLWDDVSYEARWHYIALVEECVRAHRWDGRLPLAVARRGSDVADPDKAHTELYRVGLAYVVADTVELPYIGHHIPPPGQRPDVLLPRKRENVAEYRRRKCEKGEHSKDCPAATCPVKAANKKPTTDPRTDSVTSVVTASVTGNAESSRVDTSGETQERNERDKQDHAGTCAGCGRPQPQWLLDERDGQCIECHRRAVS